jgi:hypothetical protein
MKADPDEFFRTKALSRNPRPVLAFLPVLNLLKSGHLEDSPEANRNARKEMLKMKDDPDELLKTKGKKMTLLGIPMRGSMYFTQGSGVCDD